MIAPVIPKPVGRARVATTIWSKKQIGAVADQLLGLLKGEETIAAAIEMMKTVASGGEVALDLGDYASGMADDTALDVAYTVGNALATAGAIAGLLGATGPLITGAAAVGIGVTLFQGEWGIYEAWVDADSCLVTSESWDCDEDGTSWKKGDCRDCDASVGPDDAECTGAGDVCEEFADASVACGGDSGFKYYMGICADPRAERPECTSEIEAFFACIAAEFSSGNCDAYTDECPLDDVDACAN